MQRDSFAIAFGVIVSTVLAGTLVIAGLKAGITPGVSPLVILFAWGAFTSRVSAGHGTRFLNLAQVAGSAGMAVTAGVIFTAPLLQILYRNLQREDPTLVVPPVDVVSLAILSLAGALIGFGFVGLATRKFLSDPTLPAPEARACETMIKSAVAERSARPNLAQSLYAAMGLGVLAPLIQKLGLAGGAVPLYEQQRNGRDFAVALPFDALLIGIGGLLTLSTALLVFAGAAIRLGGQYLLSSFEPGGLWAGRFHVVEGEPIEPLLRWIGGGAMTIAVAYSLLKFAGARKALHASATDEEDVLEVDPGVRVWLRMSIAAGMVILVGWLLAEDGLTGFTVTMSGAVLLCAMIMVGLGALLSLQIGSSASPVSGTIFVTTLVLCTVGLVVGRREPSDVILMTPLLVGACVAVCAANDSSQDYKTLQLCGMRVQDGFKAQFLGLLGACIVVPLVVYVADEAYTVGSDALPAPQAKMFAGLFEAILLKSSVPVWPVAIGVALGLVAVGMEILSHKRGFHFPSMAVAVGIYLPAAIGFGILTGALFRRAAEGGAKRPRGETILAAAGLITGAALLELIIGIAILGGFDEEGLHLVKGLPGWWMTTGAGIGIFVLGSILFLNARRRA